MTKRLAVAMLYPQEMNIYGDRGNLESLTRRAERHGFAVDQIFYEPGQPFPRHADVILGGGGQDSGQSRVVDDLTALGPLLKELADDGLPMLMICGLYQLFGHHFRTSQGDVIAGIGLFDAVTVGGSRRLVGNVVADWDGYRLVGYENHSGLTELAGGQAPLARVVRGAGNNGRDKTEGARTGNVFGSYLHGPILPKNPRLADELIRLAAVRRYGSFAPLPLDDSLADRARAVALSRPR
ncbi:MAG: glutamine amidotransferase [Propionibacteriaceae bacterium]|jgi:CobQ-like glutamine amidotransferase family enzyme|nr:glutamine amidotransferase [Propionibacteriaceae bacterium]